MKQAVIITGGGSGLGAALASEFANKYKVILVGRTEETLQQQSVRLAKAGADVEYYVCDMSCEQDVSSLFSVILTNNHVQFLINNAGTGIFGPLESMTAFDVEQMLNSNIKGTIYPTMALLPYFKQHQSGQIMNIISTAGLRGKVNETVYCASKFAVRGFTESLQKETENTGINVTAVYMGGMNTPFWDHSQHIADKTRLKDPKMVAHKIYEEADGRPEIFIDR
ncbi:short-chain alcohol dehydrogenase [Fictibacillus macauensis ZFHKF-1]|uniref:Short-chain alcohol dehydrogenase n=1 Tax=Fictibacillus macauensis ZFHKF-1 TaxID=1196324 RepID=I8AGX6_9BACL|nr:SDR family oxidoreductase [Fictibacillus macauensis]EIT84674.1 short-chain alcohol dehydrogenase [Fictibacillus macauensis ZFHKF-1]